MSIRQSAALRGVACALLFAAAACSGGDKGNAARRRPPAVVGFVVVKPQAVPLPVTLAGRTVAYETSEVRPQINGIVRRRLFTEGGFVRQGQPLYQIDPSLYRAAANQAAANLASARANADAAMAKAARYRPLAAEEAISKQDYTDAAAQARAARASVAQNAAALDTARINLRYTTVPAPISGRIGRSLFTAGALVGANQTSPLAVIQRLDPIYVDMQESVADLTNLRRSVQRGEVGAGSTTVRLLLDDGSDYGYTGKVQFSDVTVEQSTGTVTLRASFPNSQGLLLPGMFVKARFDQAIQPRAFLVPQPAVLRDFDGSAYVFVVGPGNKAVRRKIDANRTMGTDWVVTTGLNPGDKVITQGLSNVKDKMKVRAVPASAPQRVAVPKNFKLGQPGGGGRGGRGGGGQ